MKRAALVAAVTALVLACTWFAAAAPAQKIQIQPQMLSQLPQIKLSGSWVPTPVGTAKITLPTRVAIQAQRAQTSMTVKVPGFASEDVKGPDGVTYQRLTIPQGGLTADVGKPELPTVGTFVEVPRGVQVRVTATPVGSPTVLEKYLVWPAQEPAPDMANAPEPPFTKDKKVYATDAFWPAEMVYSTSPGVLRGTSVVHVNICPIQHNPVKRQLRVYSQVQVRVQFVGTPAADWQSRRDKYATTEFAPVLGRVVPSYVGPAPWLRLTVQPVAAAHLGAAVGVLRPPAADYLIICPPGWEDTAGVLATWREATGLKTKVTRTSDISGGSTANGIRNYIKNAYDNWIIPPSYVLLLGDANRIPVFYQSVHPSGYETGFKTGTDLYYATVDGTDLFPDVALGRLPAATEAEAGNMIAKIIAYEQNPPGGNWTRSALVACGYQSGRYFHITSDAIADFLTSKGYTVTKVYSGGSYTGTSAQVTSAINNGVFIVTHRDHGDSRHGPYGASDGWSHPSWKSAQAQALNNGARQPVVFTINCRTGWFDDETDQDGNDPGGDCLAEAFIRGVNKGAIAVVGATRISYSGYNDEMAKGFIDAVWPDFDAGYSGGAPTAARLGQVLNAGKMWMYDKYVMTGGGSYGWQIVPEKTTAEFEIFHLLGDPAMRMWTGPATPLAVSLPAPAGNNVTATVKANNAPVPGAVVVIQKPGQTTAWKKGVTAADGTWTVELDPPDEQVIVTATKPGYKPYHGARTPGVLTLTPMRPVLTPRVLNR